MSGPRFPERPAELRVVLDGAATAREAESWREALVHAAARRPLRLVVDLSRASRIDASLVVALRALERRLGPTGGTVEVVCSAGIEPPLRGLGAGDLISVSP